ncbi:MAG: YbhB/YbcL family Raf kinase inhibitor-like protein [Stellaceae bacterium]
MWRRLIMMGICLALGLALATGSQARGRHHRLPRLRVTSPDIVRGIFVSQKQVANTFGCHGGNISPEIKWSHGPDGTKSYAVTIFDPDAPTGSGFWHWVIFNIPPNVTELMPNAGDLKAGLAPKGAMMARTDFGVAGYNGPCPPPGDRPHRYRITVFAVNVPHLAGDENTPAALIGFELHFHTIAKGELIGRYGRSK